MKDLLAYLGITRQGMHARMRSLWERGRQQQVLFERAAQERKHSPGMGCRRLYGQIDTNGLPGRDACERMLLEGGFALPKRRRSFTKAGTEFVGNLAEGMVVDAPGQLWQTDITYVWAKNRWYYASFMLDVFTRQILAYRLTDSLGAADQVELLQQAAARHTPKPGLVVHTDRGVQYTSGLWRKAVDALDAKASMAHYAWENAYCERVHRTMKEEYLNHWKCTSKSAIAKHLQKAVLRYNSVRRHGSLPGRLSPDQFAREWKSANRAEHTMRIWSKLNHVQPLHLN